MFFKELLKFTRNFVPWKCYETPWTWMKRGVLESPTTSWLTPTLYHRWHGTFPLPMVKVRTGINPEPCALVKASTQIMSWDLRVCQEDIKLKEGGWMSFGGHFLIRRLDSVNQVAKCQSEWPRSGAQCQKEKSSRTLTKKAFFAGFRAKSWPRNTRDNINVTGCWKERNFNVGEFPIIFVRRRNNNKTPELHFSCSATRPFLCNLIFMYKYNYSSNDLNS